MITFASVFELLCYKESQTVTQTHPSLTHSVTLLLQSCFCILHMGGVGTLGMESLDLSVFNICRNAASNSQLVLVTCISCV